jgi:hypothetical protein
MAARGFSEKTIKIVWAKAGGMCSYPDCHKNLIVDAPSANGDPHAKLGQMAHIIAHSPEGPRGDQAFRGEDRSGPENLILLCLEHHILIDQQRNSHPVDWLFRMKEQHEQWVNERLSPRQRFIQAHPSTATVTDTLHSTLLPVTHMPPVVFSASCTLTPQEIQERIVYPQSGEANLLWPFVCFNKQLVTFCDLSAKTGPFSQCVNPQESQRGSSQLWWEDPDRARLYVMLLNRTLNKITGRRGLNLDKEHQRYYFEPLTGPRPREVAYHSLQGNKTSRQVAWQPVTRRTGSPKPYWEHLAISLQFYRVGGTANHGGGQIGLLSHSLDCMVDLPYGSFSRNSPFSPFQVARIVCPFMCPYSCSWLAPSSRWHCFGIFAGSPFDLPPHEEEPSAARSTVFSSPALQMIALPAASPLFLCRLEGQLLSMYAPGMRGKAAGEPPSA